MRPTFQCDCYPRGLAKCVGGRYLCSHNNVLILYSDLCKEWDFLRNPKPPNEYLPGSNKKVWWICSKNHCGCHHWEARINNRTLANGGCPYCYGNKSCIHNNILTLSLHLEIEWDYESNGHPSNYKKSSGKKVWWICQKNPSGSHRWKAQINRRTSEKGCPYCAGANNYIHSSLKETHFELCKEWDYGRNSLGPENYSKGTNEKVWWICSKNHCGCHRWEARINSRVSGCVCPYCSGLSKCIHSSFRETHSKLCEEWDYERNSLGPENYSKGTNEKVWWICPTNPCGCHRWEARINSRVSGCGCPYCANRQVCSHNNLRTTHFKLCEEWDFERNQNIPEKYTRGSGDKVWWKCKQGHSWMTKIYWRTNLKGTGCPHCISSRGYSKAQIEWLERIMKEQEVEIKYALSPEGEFKIPEIGKVDGYCSKTNTVYEFHGDYWHGNPKIFDPEDINQTIKKTFRELYEKTLQRDQRILDLGYNLIVKWETED